MSQKLPRNNFEWIKDICQFHEVYVQYPEKLPELHNDLPFLPGKMKMKKSKTFLLIYMIKHLDSSDHLLPLPFLKLVGGEGGGGGNFKCLPQRGGESGRLKNGGGSMVQGQVFLKGRAGTFPV